MSDLRPPSLRDTRNLTDVVRHHGLLLEKLAAGLFGGRSRIPDPLDLAGDLAAEGDAGADGDTEEPEWWDEDRHVVAGPGTVTWTLTFVVIPESLFIRWHPDGGAGLPQVRTEDWTLGDDGQTVTIPDPDGIFAAGDSFSAQYQFLDVVSDDVIPSVYSPPSWHGRSGIWGNPTSPITTVGLHVDTEVGDLLIAVSIGNAFSAIGDSRFSTIFTDGVRTFAIGYATDLTDVLCNVMGIPDPFSQFSGIEILAVRGTGPFAYDPARIAIDSPIVSGGPVGSVGGTGNGVIAVLAAAYGTTLTLDWAGLMPDYDDWGGEGVTSVVSNFGYCATEPPPAQTNPTNTNAAVVLIGLR